MQFAQSYSNVESPRPSVFGQFVPGGFISTDSSAGWLQVPPSQMPWGIPMADQPTIVRFTAESSPHVKSPEMGACGFTKRKLDSEETPLPMKQHITEEKMAAHLSQLHISPDYTAHQPEPREDEQQQQLKRLVLCDELRKLKQEPILPSSLLSRLDKPSMALVLWQPPAGSVIPLLRGRAAQAEEDNNNTSVVDLNSISTQGFVASSDSMMDL